MAKKAIKKVDVKKVSKNEVSAKVRTLFEELGIVVNDGGDYGFTDGTLVLALEKCDVQVKLITPKAGLERYSKLEEEEEEIEEVEKVECRQLNCINKEDVVCKECVRNKNANEEGSMDFLEEKEV